MTSNLWKLFFASVLVAVLFMAYTAESATISMTTPTHNTDGSLLTDLMGINLYLTDGTFMQSMAITTPGVQVSFFEPVNQLTDRKCFMATAFDDDGNESDPSNSRCTKKYRCYSCHEGQL